MSRCPSCGFDSGNANRRSNPDHRRLFSLIHAAFHQWPEGHRFDPDNPEHLRAWLICAAGKEWRDTRATFLPDEPETRALLVATVREVLSDNHKKFVVEFPGGVAVISPKSMSFAAMSQSEFGRLRDAITDVIETEIECRVEDLMREAA